MTIAEHPTLLDAAHAYRAKSWRVIQLHSVGPDGLTCSCRQGRNCPSGGKHPLDSDWEKTPALSGPDIQAAWERRPRANVGIATGEPSGFWVLDVDTDKDKGGAESLAELIAEHGNPPATYTVQTGGGGWQFYFAMPADFDVRNSGDVKGYRGIDVRGTGGQVVAPPSVSSKGSYRVARDIPIAEAPAWLLELVKKDAPEGPVTYSSDLPDRSDLDEAERRRLDVYTDRAVQANLDRLKELKVGMGPEYKGPPWNHTTFEVACSLIEIANSPWNEFTMQHAYMAVFAGAPRDSGFDDHTVNKTFESARQKVGEKARPVPPGRPQPEWDFMDGPEVRRDPTLAGGETPSPAGEGKGLVLPNPAVFFPKDDEGKSAGIDMDILGHWIRAMGPLAWGSDGVFWSYADGVWTVDPEVVTARTVRLLGSKFRAGHSRDANIKVRHTVTRLSADPADPSLINFGNGMLRWETGELLEHAPEHKSTVQLGTAWDPDATCPRFDEFLANVMTPDYVHLAWQMIGYLMYSGNPLQVAFLLHGSGGNGKGTLLRVVQELLGKHNVSSESLDSLNNNRFAAVSLYGKIANIAGDIDGTYQERTAEFKKLTGEDYFSAERKYGDRFGFTSWAVPIFSANKIPGSADVTEGYLRRWIVLGMHKRITNPTPGLSDQLIEELPGIAAKAIPALRELMDRRKFEIRGDAEKGREDFAEAIDQVRQWVKDACAPAPDRFEPRTVLYDAYKGWAERNGAGRLRAQEFHHRLEAMGYEPVSEQGIRGYTGITTVNFGIAQSSLTEMGSTVDDFFGGI